MSKLNFIFNGTAYEIDEASVASAAADLKSHLSTVMNGTGATIELGGVTYNIDATKLSAAENNFAVYLDTMSGETPEEERLEGDGAEYHTLAPTALSFRSTAPLNELRDVQINGVTVDPSNYTLTEGSTIVTFSIEYLKTLDVGDYEVTVASANKSVKGGFTVAAPTLNEYGFYYNQPYTGYVAMLGGKVAFFVRDNGTFDSVLVGAGTETGTYEISDNTLISTNSLGILHSTISSDGTEIYCNEIATAFVLGDEAVLADENYIYVYNDTIENYEAKPINHGNIAIGIPTATNICGLPITLGTYAFNSNYVEGDTILTEAFVVCNIGYGSFYHCKKLKTVTIGSNVTSISGYAFTGCESLETIIFKGTIAQWNSINKGDCWNDSNNPVLYVHCTDGDVAL